MFALPLGSPTRRQGVILLVVVSLLTLFAIVGLSFVLYAESAAKSAQFHRLAETMDRPDVEPELLLKFFLGQFVYGTDDIFSAMRGHSLAENMYGYNNKPGAQNTIPYSGMGRFSYQYPSRQPPPPNRPLPEALLGQDNFDLVNYTAFGSLDNPRPFIRDPERLGLRGTPEHDHYICGSVPYTYPDGNNMFLGAADANGRVLAQSFHRDYTGPNLRGFGPLWVNGRPSDHWFNRHPSWKYKTLRPRPADHDPNRFPPPEDEGGDVKNLPAFAGPNDSIWIDLNFPVQKTPEGRKYKPLFAAFIEDLDNRVNVNVHGNVRGVGGGIDWPAGVAGGCQSWGPWEVNLERVIRNNNEARRIFIGLGDNNNDSRLVVPGRYDVYRDRGGQGRFGHWGKDAHRVLTSRLPFGPFYSRTNSDANPHDENERDAIRLPGGGATVWHRHHSFPHYTGAYANADQGTEARNNPVFFNFLDPRFTSYDSGGVILYRNDRVFPHSNLEALLRYGDTGSPAHTSELFLLCQNSFRDAPRTRRLVSTIGFDVDRPGVIPSECGTRTIRA